MKQKQDLKNLHSSMDRLETFSFATSSFVAMKFTFQYGQIRNAPSFAEDKLIIRIYIPVWIDQKHMLQLLYKLKKQNLHSSMDRLETINQLEKEITNKRFTFQYGQIRNEKAGMNKLLAVGFTFQYGQIRNYFFF